MRTTNRYLVWTCVSLLFACRDKGSGAAHDAGIARSSSSIASPSSASDAGVRRPLDLLHWGPARLAVSSNVENPRDYPEHLVDGNDETAWNSKTGDLVGATIAFEVPADAAIVSLVLSAGFAKTGAAGEDLFSMNHRIRTVQVFAGATEGEPIATLELDPTRRAPQTFPFARPGGLYRLKVTAVQPGTKKEWRELAVSEFRVIGIPGAVAYGMPRLPDVAIAKEWDGRPLPGVGGSKEASYQGVLGTAYPTVDALCKSVASALRPDFEKIGQPVRGPEACVTKAIVVPSALPAPIKRISWVDLIIPEGSAGTFVLETDKGFVIPRNAELASAPCVPGCMDDMVRVTTLLEKAESAGGNIVLHVKQSSSSSEAPDEQGNRVGATETRWFALKCALAAEPVTCARVETKASCALGTKEVPCR